MHPIHHMHEANYPRAIQQVQSIEAATEGVNQVLSSVLIRLARQHYNHV